MLHPSTKKLIDKLQEMTSASKIDWREGDDGTCFYDTEGYRVTIAQAPSRLVLQDAGGRVLETASETLLSGTVGDDGSSYAMKVDQMVSDARRQLTGSPAIIDQIVSALDLDGDGVPDVEQSGEEVEQISAAESLDSPGYPGQTEMASRVAMLAESVNTDSVSVPPSAEPESEDEVVVDEVMAEGSDVSEEMPVEASEIQTTDDTLGREAGITTETAAEDEPQVEPVQESEPEQVEAVEAVETVEEPVAEVQDEAPVSGDAVSALAGGLTGAATGYAASQLATNSGMTEPETGSGEAWAVPEAAESSPPSEEIDFAPDEIETADSEPVTQYSPTDVVNEDEIAAEAPEEAVHSASAFGSIGAFGAAEEAAAPADAADMSAPEPELAEAVVQPAMSWGEATPAVDAQEVVPSELVDVSDNDMSIDASDDEGGSIEVFESDDTDVDQYISAAESEVAEPEATEPTEPASPVRTGGLAAGLAGTPYVTGLGRVGHTETPAPETVEVTTETVSEASDELNVTAHDISNPFTETNLEPPSVEPVSDAADFVSESAETGAAEADGLVSEVSETATAAFNTAGDTAASGVETLTEAASAVEETVDASVPDFGTPELNMPQAEVPETSGNLMADVSETLTGAGEDTAFAAEADEAPMDAVSDVVEAVSDQAESVSDVAGDAVDTMASAAEEQLSGVASSVGGFGTGVAEEASQAAETVTDSVEDVDSEAVSETPVSVSEPESLSGHIESGFQNTAVAVSGAFEAAAPEASAEPETDISVDAETPSDQGGGFISGLAGGVASAATSVVKDVSNTVQSAVETVTGSEVSETEPSAATEENASEEATEDEPKKTVFKYNPWM